MAITDKEAERIEATVGRLPDSIESVLEVGFSDGRMTSALRARVPRCVSLDLPRPIRDGVTAGRVFGTIAALPFADHSFDAVVCCEVLEHLPPDIFEPGTRELQRVAARNILITVPFEQRVQNERARCTRCGMVGHPYFHLRSFDEATIRRLLPDWRLVYVQPFGRPIHGYAPDWMYRIKFAAGGYIRRGWRCPRCRETSPGTEHNVVAKLVSKAIRHIEASRPPRAPWVMALWQHPGIRT